jgi:hypothetical protein
MIPNEVHSSGQITSEQVTTHDAAPADYTLDADVLLVNRDERRAEAWLTERQWALAFRESDILYQSPKALQQWDGAQTARANVSRFTVAKSVNSLVPTCMAGIFYEMPPFVLRPTPAISQNTVRAKTALISALLNGIDFKAECETGIECQSLNGTGFWKWGYTRKKRIEKKFIRKKSPVRLDMPLSPKQAVVHTKESDEFEVQEIEVEEWLPFFEHCPIGTLGIDPGWRHANRPWRAKYVTHKLFLTYNDLNDLRNDESYYSDAPSEGGEPVSRIPDSETLKSWFMPQTESARAVSEIEASRVSTVAVHHAERRDVDTTDDPLEQPLKVVERWDKTYVRTVVQDKYLIRKQKHGLGQIPFFSANWWNIQDSGYGLGMGRLIGSDQRIEQGTMNALIDMLSLWTNQMAVRLESANVPTQQIRSRLGGILTLSGTDDVRKGFAWLDGPKIPPELFTTIASVRQASESVSGADENFVQGQVSGKQGAARSATGAGAIAAASATRVQGPVGRFVDNVFIPFLQKLDEMICEHMPMSQIRRIIGEELGDDFELDEDEFLNSSMKFDCLAGAHLAAKKAMAQSLPFMIPLLENPHLIQQLNQTGYTVDVKELFNMILEMSEWKNNRELIRKMTKEEFQMFQSFDPTLQKIKGDLIKQKQKHNDDGEDIDQKSKALMARDVVKHAIEGGEGGNEGGGQSPSGAPRGDFILSSPERAAGYESRVGYEHDIAGGPFGGA